MAAPVLAEALKGHPDTNRACWNALIILEMMGPEAKDAVPALLRASQEEARLGTRGPYDNPALLPTIGGHRGGVLHELEPKDVDEESNRRIVFMYHDRYKLKKGHRCPFWL